MTTRHGRPAPRSRLATTAVVFAAAAVLFSFFAQGLAFFLLFVALIIAVVVLVRTRRGHPGKGPAIAAVVASILALIIGTATSPAGQQGYQQATQGTPPPTPPAAAPDPNVLPAAVVVATVQSPDNLVSADGRRLHVTMMQGHPASGACQVGTDAATATTLVQNKQVRISAPDAGRTDAAGAVPPGFQQVIMALPDGRDYARTWAQVAADRWEAACLTTRPTPEPTPTSSDPTPTTTDQEADVDRPYIPVPARPRTHAGHSGHPCLPGERDGDHDGYCGE